MALHVTSRTTTTRPAGLPHPHARTQRNQGIHTPTATPDNATTGQALRRNSAENGSRRARVSAHRQFRALAGRASSWSARRLACRTSSPGRTCVADLLADHNFENGYGAWRPVNFAQAVTPKTVQNPARAKQGNAFMQFRTTQPGGSMAHRRRGAIRRDRRPRGRRPLAPAVQFSVWLRSAAGPPNVQGAVALWGSHLPGPGSRQKPALPRSTSGRSGTQVSVGFDLVSRV